MSSEISPGARAGGGDGGEWVGRCRKGGGGGMRWEGVEQRGGEVKTKRGCNIRSTRD